ncbi:glycoside hydrolase [Marinoscillum furvescens]|uniref:O-glycosyl hydrolase n=1 Tax=Marinoscillum furvescens DSM 4134 TaxID=1122208 RepID=A0A3D9L0P4_MARFU|nr:glycoside hydrolase [Marinoscillum furvescens]RED97014.1 O-glycosyl hydrolase [Marinoscillum furvescens DSM 4134]
MTKLFNLLMLTGILVASCSPEGGGDDANDDTPRPAPTEILLKPEVRHQVVHNFGASDAWSVQFIGDQWPVDKRKAIADLLFSTENKSDGSPIGIGLSAWRFNIGAGSTEQGDDSQIDDEWRRAPGFLQADGTYDWSAQQGQLNFLKDAAERGVATFIGFVNSPPVSFTRNGKAWSDDGTKANIAAENYEDFAVFLAEVSKGIRDQAGVDLDYLSPFNEPQWDWKCCGQEGSPWNNSEIYKATVVIDSVLNAQGLNPQIELTEAGKIDYLFAPSDKPHRGDQIRVFFDPSSAWYVGDLSSVAGKVAGHSYFSTWDAEWLISSRRTLWERIGVVDAGLEYWMTEYCLLEDNEEMKGSGRDLGMDAAMYLAKVIHADMAIANSSVWQWWLAISPYDYKDGLVYIDHNKSDGAYYESKMLWTLGHYSRFIRPGYRRIATAVDGTSKDTVTGLMVSAYQSPEAEQTVVVLTNPVKGKREVVLRGIGDGELDIYQTSAAATDNLTFLGTFSTGDTLTVPGRALVTCVIR